MGKVSLQFLYISLKDKEHEMHLLTQLNFYNAENLLHMHLANKVHIKFVYHTVIHKVCNFFMITFFTGSHYLVAHLNNGFPYVPY